MSEIRNEKISRIPKHIVFEDVVSQETSTFIGEEQRGVRVLGNVGGERVNITEIGSPDSPVGIVVLTGVFPAGKKHTLSQVVGQLAHGNWVMGRHLSSGLGKNKVEVVEHQPHIKPERRSDTIIHSFEALQAHLLEKHSQQNGSDLPRSSVEIQPAETV